MADLSPPDPAPVELRALSDRALLRMYVQTGDDQAFRTIVERHAALVLGACRRGLQSAADADDAFQATFLVLARSAGKIRRREALAAWLYGVATRVSLRMRRDRARRHTQELMDIASQHVDPLDELLARHDEMVADEELGALPESLRTPLVLRYLAGKSNADVAAELGITVAALEGRLKRGKQRLRIRLLRRGVTLATMVAVLKATRVAAADVPGELLGATTELCTTSASATISSLASEPTTSTHFALQELNAMNTMIASKPLVAALAVSSIAALVVTAQLAFSQGDATVESGAFALDATASSDESPFDATPTKLAPEPVKSDDNPFDNADASATTVRSDADLSRHTVKSSPTSAGIVDLKPRSPSELRIEAALVSPLNNDGVVFDESPLSEVAGFLQTEYDIPIVIDTRALDDLGLSTDDPVTVSLRDIKLDSALNLMLPQLDLTYIIKDEVLFITSEEEAATQLETRVYPHDFLQATPDEVAQLITSTVAPDTWDHFWGVSRVGGNASDNEKAWRNGGGESTISTQLPDRLIIRQTYAVHQEINELLSQLKQAAEAK